MEEKTQIQQTELDDDDNRLAAAYAPSVSSISDKVCIVLNHPLTKNHSGRLFWTTIGTRRFLAGAHMK